MNIQSNISVLYKECEARNFTWHEGLRINVSSDINIPNNKIVHTFTMTYDNAQNLLYIAGLTDSCHDNYEFAKNNPTVPKLNLQYQYVEDTIPPRTKELIAVYQAVNSLSRYDKKENRKLQNAKGEVLAELLKDIRYSIKLGTGMFKNGHEFPLSVVESVESILKSHIATLQEWKLSKETKRREEETLRENQIESQRRDCISFLVERGLTPSVLENLSLEILRPQVDTIAIYEYVKETGFTYNIKEYDDRGRFTCYLECYHDSASHSFYVVKEQEYY